MICPDRDLALNALIDGELDRAGEADLLAHIVTCPGCAAGLAGLLALRARLAAIAPCAAVPAALTERIAAALTPRPRRGPAWRAAATGAAASALAAGLVLALLPRGPTATLRAVADAGLRERIEPAALNLSHTRLGGADAWFARHHLAIPPVPDLAAAGFRFAGCRTDVVAGHRAAILVYRQGERRGGPDVTVLAWPAGAAPAPRPLAAEIAGRSVRSWTQGRLAFWAETRAPAPILAHFVTSYRASRRPGEVSRPAPP